MKPIDKKIREWAEAAQTRELNKTKTPDDIIYHLKRAQPERNVKPFARRRSILQIILMPASLLVLIVIVFRAAGLLDRNAQSNRPETDLNSMKILCEELVHIFPEGIQWSRSINGGMEIHAGNPRRVNGEPTAEKVLISYDTVKKRDGKAISRRHDFFIVWREEPVEISGGREGTLWIQKADDSRLFISLNLTIRNPLNTFYIQDEYLQPYGMRNRIASKTDRGDQYELYQTAFRL